MKRALIVALLAVVLAAPAVAVAETGSERIARIHAQLSTLFPGRFDWDPEPVCETTGWVQEPFTGALTLIVDCD